MPRELREVGRVLVGDGDDRIKTSCCAVMTVLVCFNWDSGKVRL